MKTCTACSHMPVCSIYPKFDAVIDEFDDGTFDLDALSIHMQAIAEVCAHYAGPAKSLNPQLSIDYLEMTARTTNALKGGGIFTVEDMLKHTAHQIKRFDNLGQKSFTELTDTLHAYDLRLAG